MPPKTTSSSGRKDKGKGREPEPVMSQWNPGVNRGSLIETSVDKSFDVGANARASVASWDDGLLEDPVPDFLDRLAEVEVTTKTLEADLIERFDILKERPINYLGWHRTLEDMEDCEPTEQLDAGWVSNRQASEVADELRIVLAQRDAAIGSAEHFRMAMRIYRITTRSLLQRVRSLEAEGVSADTQNRIEALIADKIRLEDEKIALERELLSLHRQAHQQGTNTQNPHQQGTNAQNPPRSPWSAPSHQGSDEPRPSVETQGTSTRKTARIADPDKFTDGKAPKLSVWKAALKRKLEGNSELFPTEACKFGYALSHIGGDAMEALDCHLEDGALEPITTLEDLIDFLECQYKDPTELQQAKNDFHDLAMSTGQSYREFLTSFVQTASKAGIPKAEWKYEFNRRLTWRLQVGMTRDYIDETVNFEEFSRLGHQYALQYRAIDKQKSVGKKGTSSGGTSSRGSGGTTGTKNKSTTPARQGSRDTPSTRQLTEAEKKERGELREQGKCFFCKKTGHLKANCPDRIAAAIKLLEAQPGGQQQPQQPEEDPKPSQESEN